MALPTVIQAAVSEDRSSDGRRALANKKGCRGERVVVITNQGRSNKRAAGINSRQPAISKVPARVAEKRKRQPLVESIKRRHAKGRWNQKGRDDV
jgi:hypothetical protein